MALIAAAWLRGVVNLTAFKRAASLGRLVEELHLPADFLLVVVGFVGAEGSSEELGPRLGTQDIVQRRDAAVVEVGGGCPDAVEGRGLIAGGCLRFEALG